MSKTITVDGTTWERSSDDYDGTLATFETPEGREVWIDGDGVNIQNERGEITYAPIEVVEASIAANRAACASSAPVATTTVSAAALPALPDAIARLAYSYKNNDGTTTTVGPGFDENGVECLVVDNTGAELVQYLRIDVVAAVLAARGSV